MIFKTKRTGNALLISLLLMSVLILLTVGLSRIIGSETRQIAEMIRNSKAEYLAEAGTEIAQYYFYQTAPGSEKRIQGLFTHKINDDDEQFKVYLTQITNHIPIKDKELLLSATTDEQKQLLFAPLKPGESVEIPLLDEVSGFEIEYYIPTINNSALGDFTQQDLDILLFRLSGVEINEQDKFKINFITEYFPAGAPTDDNTITGKSAQQPAKICTTYDNACFNGGKFFKYSEDEQEQELTITTNNESDTNLLNFNIQTSDQPEPPKGFKTFLDGHTNNIITMSNAINLSTIQAGNITNFDMNILPKIQEALGTIYYRVCSPNCNSRSTEQGNLVSPNVLIESTGIFFNTQKNKITELTRPTGLSVFDFAIFQTE